MNKRLVTVIMMTIGFIVVAAIFVVLHRQSDTTAKEVDAAYMQAIDTNLQNSFAPNLEARQGNDFAGELGF